ncbi:nucleoside-diphosphate kinase [Catellatospora methionotrophica]|uniref:nucleoside-diphosphate kinase n=1 Tax=Catellatospora methionotrophica TaxID=121620 RepID=UPI00340178C5
MTVIDWSLLTRTARKVELYRDEVYLREAWADLCEVAGQDRNAVLSGSALLVVRPEGVRSGRLDPTLKFLDRHGFRIVATEPVGFDRMLARELWRYQHTLASLDRLAVVDQMLSVGPALLLLMHGPDGAVPATTALSRLKGASNPAGRPPGTLRELLDQPNRLFALVHCADEPADLVRELGILVDSPTRRRLIRALVDGELAAADAARLAEFRAAPTAELDVPAALKRICAEVAAAGTAGHEALRLLDASAGGSLVPWRHLMGELTRLGIRPSAWDLALVGSSSIEYDEPHAVKLLGSPDLDAWSRPDD